MRYRFIIILLLIIPLLSSAQRWKRSRYEVVYGVGISNVFGDLGGSNSTSKFDPLSVRDFDFGSIRYNAFVGARYKIIEKIAVKLNVIYADLYGSDNFTTLDSRRDRQLSFNSSLFETSAQIEISLTKERYGRKFTWANIMRTKLKNVNTYVFMGVGAFSFNPQAKKNGIELPQGTYSKFQGAFPVGLGIKYGINRKLSFGVEISNRYTTTDYLDNHSDPMSSSNDSYFLALFNFCYKLKTTRSGLPRF